MNSATICIIISIVVYLGSVLMIGFHFMKKNESTSDFYLGGRKLGSFVTAMSAEASDMSGGGHADDGHARVLRGGQAL